MKESLFIFPQHNTKLPIYYHFSHNIAVRLYDDLVWIVKDEKTQKKGVVKVKIKNGLDKFDENKEHIVDWLQRNGYQFEVDKIISTQLIFAIIADICHFIYQALDSAKNIKMTVAYSLIRKPFLENLLIIEQLLTEESIFLRKFESDSKKFDLSKISLDKKKELIENSIDKVSTNYILNPEIINELRWDKSNSNSIYANSNMATHLITTRGSSYKTEKQNLNFVFSGFEEWDAQLSHFYYFVPMLLFYSVEIIDQYLLEKKIITLKKFKERKFLRLFGQMLHYEQNEEDKYQRKSAINKIVKKFKVKCKNCNRVNSIYKSDVYYLVHEGYLLCKFCLNDLLNETDSMRGIMNKLIKK